MNQVVIVRQWVYHLGWSAGAYSLQTCLRDKLKQIMHVRLDLCSESKLVSCFFVLLRVEKTQQDLTLPLVSWVVLAQDYGA